jgi:hypothetical protein
VAPSRRSTAFAGLAIATLALTGCSVGSTAASTQTSEQACDVLASGVSATTTKLQASLSTLATDPETAADDVTTLTSDFEKSAAGVENPELKRLAKDATAALGDFDEKIHAYAANPTDVDNQAAMQTSAEGVQDAIGAIGATCP